ncbi:type I-E CRISPR-associated protein Cse2/CasB [Streptomyces sp. NPDC058685]|uniref:type I-E CRISPR-associated protein Cse2/CasB n=1 Tax=Streptomyces sp. NPDC058685 TaxID=3346598 RepID=UPI00365F257E
MTTTAAPPSVPERLRQLAAAHITPLQEGYLRDDSKAVAALARLRRGAGKEAGQLPDLWALVDTGPLHTVPDGARPLDEEALTRAEDALHAALTLWALHQQSRPTRMHQPGSRQRPTGLGTAVRRLMPADDIDEPLLKRLVRAGTAPDLTSLAQRLRDIVLLLRREDIPLDYALLTSQLYRWQYPGGPDTVRREWGRSFHARRDTAPNGTHTPAHEPGLDDIAETPDTKDAP